MFQQEHSTWSYVQSETYAVSVLIYTISGLTKAISILTIIVLTNGVLMNFGQRHELINWAKCGESSFSVVPTLLWAVGAAALAHRLLSALFRRFLFRRVPLWEIILQHLLFLWIIIYSLHFWVILVRVLKIVVNYCYEDESTIDPDSYHEGQKVMQQWVIWMCGAAPLAFFIHTQPRPEHPPMMIWITTSPWQRREMGPYGYYLNRPLSSLQSTTNLSHRQQALSARRAFSDSKIIIKEPAKKKRNSKSV